MKCPKCQMAYDEDSPDDRRLHRTYHDEIVNGIPVRQLNSDETIWQQNKDSIIVVNAFSPRAQRIRAAKVGRVANLEMHYDFGVYSEHEGPDDREIHLFLYCSVNRAVGLSILENRSSIWRYTWEEYDKNIEKTLEKGEPIWSLGFTWVHNKHHRHGIAKILLMEATRYLGVRISDIGLYTPLSDDGEAFARSIFPESFFIAK
jgi:ribosomal protein S18 acetylase RimI-like enzyme